MTATMIETVELPDLNTALPCECPGDAHGPDGCEREAAYRVANPCGHQAELLCGPCTSDILRIVADGCPNCDGWLLCPDCGEDVDHMEVQPI